MAAELERFGVSMEPELLHAFDETRERKGYPSRSEALRDLVRGWLNEHHLAHDDDGHPAVGTLTLFYDHTRRELADRLTQVGHAHHHVILTAMHVHLDHARCMEVLALKGPAGELRRLSDQLIAMKGIEHGRLVLTSRAGEDPHGHEPHEHGDGHFHTHG